MFKLIMLALISIQAHGAPDYTERARSEYRKDPVNWCAEYESSDELKDEEEPVRICKDAMTDGCIVYLEECKGLKFRGGKWH